MSKTPMVIRAASEAEYPRIAALLDRIFKPRPYEQRLRLWNWRYDDNPSRSPSIPHFIVAEQNGDLVAVQGLVPLKLKMGATEQIVSCGADLAADPAVRSVGMKIKLRAVSPETSPLHLSTSQNEAANRIAIALGGHEVPGGRRKYILPLRLEKLIGRRLEQRFGSSMGGVIGQLIGRPGSAALAAKRVLGRHPKSDGARVETIHSFDERFTRLWNAISVNTSVAIVRDREYLEWRYLRYPFPAVHVFALTRGDTLVGFAAIHIATDKGGLVFAAILELCVEPGNEAGFTELLHEAIARAVQHDAHYVIALAPAREWDAVIATSGFIVREEEWSPATYKNNTDLPNTLFSSEHNWYMSLGDGDRCFYLG